MTIQSLSTEAPGPGIALGELGSAAIAALTDGMVERLVVTGTSGLEVLDRLNEPDTKAAVHHLIDGLTALHNSGALATVFELAQVAHAARAAATDGMVERLIGFAETMVTNLATEEIAELARETERAMYDAVDRCAASNSAPTSLWGLFRELSKPENLKMINLLMTFGKCMCERPSVMSRQQK